tara:strand:- start:266 stop:463 length:198 start_codon:yes stop_codon:yes gene_type:complete
MYQILISKSSWIYTHNFSIYIENFLKLKKINYKNVCTNFKIRKKLIKLLLIFQKLPDIENDYKKN